MFTKVAGNIDTETLTVLIDGSDIDIDPEVDDRFDLDNEEHTVTKVDYLDSDLGFLLRAKRLEGQ
ncbi:MAG: hypothetical protein CMK92_06050 [Pseudomonas sp.]|nr:hypothetical protein [Pseudomonas sp.]